MAEAVVYIYVCVYNNTTSMLIGLIDLYSCNIGHFFFYFCFDLPLIGQTKSNFFFFKNFSFLFGLLGGKSKQKYFTGGKTENDLY